MAVCLLFLNCNTSSVNKSLTEVIGNFSEAKKLYEENKQNLQRISSIISENKNIDVILRQEHTNLINDKIEYRFQTLDPKFHLDMEISKKNEEQNLKDIFLNGISTSDEYKIKGHFDGKYISLDSINQIYKLENIYGILNLMQNSKIKYIGREASFPNSLRLKFNDKTNFLFSEKEIPEELTKYSIIKKIESNWYYYYDKNDN